MTDDNSVGMITDGAAETVSGQFKADSLFGGAGNMASKEGVDRYEEAQPEADKQTTGILGPS